MYSVKDNGIVCEIACGYNFGYVIQYDEHFAETYYEDLKNQITSNFVKCVKMLYNGKIEMFYLTDQYRPLSVLVSEVNSDILIVFMLNIFEIVSEVDKKKILRNWNIDISWDKIFVDPDTYEVKMVYIPLNVEIFQDFTEFQEELRKSLVKLMRKANISIDVQLSDYLADMASLQTPLEIICNKYESVRKHFETDTHVQNNEKRESISVQKSEQTLKMVAINGPKYFEIVIDKEKILLGKNPGFNGVSIYFNARISRKHCSVFRTSVDYYIVDEESTNGTFLNNVRLLPHQPALLKKGDMVRLADSEFRIV